MEKSIKERVIFRFSQYWINNDDIEIQKEIDIINTFNCKLKVLGFDSLDCVEFEMILEDEFDISFDDFQLNQDNTLNEIVTIIEEKLQG